MATTPPSLRSWLMKVIDCQCYGMWQRSVFRRRWFNRSDVPVFVTKVEEPTSLLARFVVLHLKALNERKEVTLGFH